MSIFNTSIQIGQSFSNRFKIIKCLGVGGMGEVYLAEDQLLSNSQVALKLLNRELSQEPKQVDRFLREVLLTRKVSHNNVVKTFDASIIDTQLYFVMEYVDGKTLREVIEGEKISVARGINYIKQIAQGLDAIHQAEIIHRDLKPANIILQINGTVKIADFGIARPDNSEITQHNEIIGSSHFMSPEAWKGGNISFKTDLYSLGVIAFQIFTGQLPFDGNTSAQIMFKHLEGKVPNIKDINPEAPSWLNNLILDLLSTDPALRPALSHVISSLETGGLSVRSSTKTNLKFHELNQPSVGYVSSNYDRQGEFSSIWDPNELPTFTKEKNLANPNFGSKNLEEATFKGKIRKILNELDTQEKTLENFGKQFFLVLLISGATLWLVLPMLGNLSTSMFSTQESLYLRSLKVIIDSIGLALIIAWPILIIDCCLNSFREAIKKYLKLALISLVLIAILTLVYAYQLNAFTPKNKELNYKYLILAVQIANPKALINILESSLLFPIASYFEIFFTNNLPAIKEYSLELNWKISFYYLTFATYLSTILFLLRNHYHRAYQNFKYLYLLPTVFLVVYCLEILIYLKHEASSSQSILRESYNLGFITLNLSSFQVYCSLINWLLILVTLKFVIPLLGAKRD